MSKLPLPLDNFIMVGNHISQVLHHCLCNPFSDSNTHICYWWHLNRYFTMPMRTCFLMSSIRQFHWHMRCSKSMACDLIFTINMLKYYWRCHSGLSSPPLTQHSHSVSGPTSPLTAHHYIHTTAMVFLAPPALPQLTTTHTYTTATVSLAPPTHPQFTTTYTPQLWCLVPPAHPQLTTTHTYTTATVSGPTSPLTAHHYIHTTAMVFLAPPALPQLTTTHTYTTATVSLAPPAHPQLTTTHTYTTITVCLAPPVHSQLTTTYTPQLRCLCPQIAHLPLTHHSHGVSETTSPPAAHHHPHTTPTVSLAPPAHPQLIITHTPLPRCLEIGPTSPPSAHHHSHTTPMGSLTPPAHPCHTMLMPLSSSLLPASTEDSSTTLQTDISDRVRYVMSVVSLKTDLSTFLIAMLYAVQNQIQMFCRINNFLPQMLGLVYSILLCWTLLNQDLAVFVDLGQHFVEGIILLGPKVSSYHYVRDEVFMRMCSISC